MKPEAPRTVYFGSSVSAFVNAAPSSREVRIRPVAIGENALVRRPLDRESRIVPAHAASELGDERNRNFVVDDGVVQEGLEAVRAAGRDVEHSAVLFAELGGEPFAKGARPAPEIEYDVVDGAARHRHHLLFFVWSCLEVHPAQGPLSGVP